MQGIKIYPDLLREEAEHRIGICQPDDWGKMWTYCEFPAGTWTQGTVVGDSRVVTSGTITADAAAGTDRLQDTGEFDGDDFRGAIGEITAGTGAGQQFQVIETLDANTLQIANLFKNNDGWENAVSTGATYKLIMPGRVVQGTGPHVLTRGVIQRATFTVPANEFRYAWVQQTKYAKIRLDLTSPATAVGTNLRVVPGAGGLGIGAADTVPAEQIIGHLPHGVPAATADGLYLIYLCIKNESLSFRKALKRDDAYRGVRIT